MKLSAEKFYLLLASLRPGACCGLDEMRQEPRVEIVGHARISPREPNTTAESFPVGVRDLSRSGIGVVHVKPLPVGEEFILLLPTPEDANNGLVYKVVRCNRLGSKLFNIGARLMSELAVQAAA